MTYKSRNDMRKLILSLLAALTLTTGAFADEGMWLLPLLQKLNSKAMKDLGCKLSPKDIYDVNHTSLKDAIVIFGGGCTGEVISDEGLLVTNHHCGYSSIQALSSDEHNYLEDGFWAMDRGQEIPVPGLSVTFLVNMTDVTKTIETGSERLRETFADSTNAEALVAEAMEALESQLVEEAQEKNPGCVATVTPFYNDNVHYLIVYKRYTDIRFVGAPPVSVGKFGGETDNWTWPRHTGDFSMFRIYAGKDNEPAAYSADNEPFKPKRSLTISLKGVKEGDYAMVMGFPGSTQRFQTKAQLDNMIARHDISIEARTISQDIMWKWMEESPSTRLKYANKYASSANGWKKWIGEKKAFADLDIIGREERKEAEFMDWVSKDPARVEKYGTALDDVAEGVALSSDANKAMLLLYETIGGIELQNFCPRYGMSYERELRQGKDSVAAAKAAVESMARYYEDYHEPLDKERAVAMLEHYRKNAKPEYYLNGLGGDFASLDIKKYVDELYAGSAFTSMERLTAATANGAKTLASDPATLFYGAMREAAMSVMSDTDRTADGKIAEGSKAFAAGLLEWQAGKPSYPDANFTMRLTYGSVLPYSPKDAVTYRYYTTLDGVMEKEDPGNYEFKVPAKLKELYEAKDFGRYAMKDGKLPTCFLTNNDITGGNSGSPVLNAKGELIGLAFDGNWEAMSGDVMFEPDLQRCICVDIRYVLFLMDKLGGAGHLLDEMNIVR